MANYLLLIGGYSLDDLDANEKIAQSKIRIIDLFAFWMWISHCGMIELKKNFILHHVKQIQTKQTSHPNKHKSANITLPSIPGLDQERIGHSAALYQDNDTVAVICAGDQSDWVNLTCNYIHCAVIYSDSINFSVCWL